MRRSAQLAALTLAGLTMGGPSAQGSAQDLRIPILVRETAGVARSADPVTVGVPLPAAAGVLDPGQLALVDQAGTPVATQARVLGRWSGTAGDVQRPIRWLAVHFQADVAANGTARYVLARATPAVPAPPLPALARAVGDGVRVDTGPLGFRVASDRFRLLDEVRIDLDGDGELDIGLVEAGHDGGARVQRLDGSMTGVDQDGPLRVTIEDNGPLAAVIRIDARHVTQTARPATMKEGRPPHPWLEFTARIHAYRDKPWVRVSYTVRNPDRFRTGNHNQGGEPVAHEFEALGLVLPLQTLGDPLTLTLGGEALPPWAPAGSAPPASAAPAWRVPLPAGSTAVLYQDSSGSEGWADSADGTWGTSFRGYLASLDQQALGRGHHAAGWGDVSALAWGVTVGVDDFWQSFPKGLRFTGRGEIAIDLWPEQSRRPHRLEGGRQKTHELFLDFHRHAGADVASFSSFAAPLRATVPPRWYRDTLALGPVATLDDDDDPATWRLRAIAAALLDPTRGLQAERERHDLYGWRDFGDSYRAGDKEHRTFGNNEFDFGWSLLGLYLLDERQDPRYLEMAEPMLRHLADIDIYHTGEDAGAYSHGVRQHDGAGSTDHARPPLLSHYWIRGLLTYYWITGERLALDAALETGQWLEALVDPDTGELAWHGQSRSQAWGALGLTELWEATGEPRYLELAGRLLHREVVADSASALGLPCGGLDWEGDSGARTRDSASPWQNGYVAEALGRYALDRRIAGAPDAGAEQALFRILEALATCGFATPDNGLFVAGDASRDDEVYGRRYRALVLDRIYPDGRTTIEYPNNHLLTDGFAYGALLTSDASRRRSWLELAQETWMWTMGPESAPGDARSQPVYCCPETPAKNAAMDLRFGQVWRWLRQRIDSSTSP